MFNYCFEIIKIYETKANFYNLAKVHDSKKCFGWQLRISLSQLYDRISLVPALISICE